MKTKLIITFAWIALTMLYSCRTQSINKQTSNDPEKYDFNAVNKLSSCTGVVRNGWTILMYSMDSDGAWYREYPPVPEFYMVYKTFYPNGNIESVGKIIGEDLRIGDRVYFDDRGNITEIVDEDKKLGKIKVKDILKFIEKEGYINLSTGEGRECAVITPDGSGYIKHGRFSIIWGEKEYFVIIIAWGRWNDNLETVYKMDKKTGKKISKECEKVYPTY